MPIDISDLPDSVGDGDANHNTHHGKIHQKLKELDAAVENVGTTSWDEVTNKPTEFAPEAHTHDASEITNLPTGGSGGVSSWNDLTDKPTEFTPEPHTHEVSEVTGLEIDQRTPSIQTDAMKSLRSILAGRFHRPVNIMGIGDSWLEMMGQSIFDLTVTADVAAIMSPSRGSFCKAVFHQDVPTYDDMVTMLGDNPAPNPARYADARSSYQEFGGDGELQFHPGQQSFPWAEVWWFEFKPEGVDYYAPGLKIHNGVEWIDTPTDGSTVKVTSDSGDMEIHAYQVQRQGYQIKVKPSSPDAGGDGQGRCVVLGVHWSNDQWKLGIQEFNHAHSGRSMAYWNEWADGPFTYINDLIAKMVNPEIIWISSTGNDAAQGLDIETEYKPYMRNIIQFLRDRSTHQNVPVVFTTQSYPDISNPSDEASMALWNSYLQASKDVMDEVGGVWLDIGGYLGPMSSLSVPNSSGGGIWRDDYGVRIDDIHLSNLGAQMCADYIVSKILDM